MDSPKKKPTAPFAKPTLPKAKQPKVVQPRAKVTSAESDVTPITVDASQPLPVGIKSPQKNKSWKTFFQRFNFFKKNTQSKSTFVSSSQAQVNLNLQDQQNRFIDDPSVKKRRFSSFNQKVGALLKDKKALKREWIIVGSLNALVLLFFAVLVGIENKFVTLSATFYPAIALQAPINNALWGIAIFVLANISLPFIMMFVLFLLGVRDVTSAKHVHYFIWILMIINLLFLFVSCCLLAAAYANLDSYNLWRGLEALNPNN